MTSRAALAVLGTDGTVGGPGGSPLASGAAASASSVSASPFGGIDAWVPTTFYPANVLIANGGSTYICKVAHTSGASFSGIGANWQLVGASSLGSARTVTSTGGTTLSAADSAVFFDATAGAISQTLPTAVGFVGLLFLVATSAGPNLVTFSTTGGQTIGAYPSGTLTIGTPASGAPFSAVSLMSDGTNWQIV